MAECAQAFDVGAIHVFDGPSARAELRYTRLEEKLHGSREGVFVALFAKPCASLIAEFAQHSRNNILSLRGKSWPCCKWEEWGLRSISYREVLEWRLNTLTLTFKPEGVFLRYVKPVSRSPSLIAEYAHWQDSFLAAGSTLRVGVRLAPASQIAEHAHSPDSCCGNLKYFKSGSESESWSGCEPELQWLEVGVFKAQARLVLVFFPFNVLREVAVPVTLAAQSWTGFAFGFARRWCWYLHQNSADIDVDITSNFFNASKTCQCQCEGGMRWDEIIRARLPPSQTLPLKKKKNQKKISNQDSHHAEVMRIRPTFSASPVCPQIQIQIQVTAATES
ncbi:hypothetical protein B0H13DRAFT_1912701 [Mycena leptocephala]|nr:hypothetical protein B0H13DRAFT_1912701 [Mycena leptocephala]